MKWSFISMLDTWNCSLSPPCTPKQISQHCLLIFSFVRFERAWLDVIFYLGVSNTSVSYCSYQTPNFWPCVVLLKSLLESTFGRKTTSWSSSNQGKVPIGGAKDICSQWLESDFNFAQSHANTLFDLIKFSVCKICFLTDRRRRCLPWFGNTNLHDISASLHMSLISYGKFQSWWVL